MEETIDLIAHRELRNLQRFTRDTGQPTKLAELDLEPTSFADLEASCNGLTVVKAT